MVSSSSSSSSSASEGSDSEAQASTTNRAARKSSPHAMQVDSSTDTESASEAGSSSESSSSSSASAGTQSSLRNVAPARGKARLAAHSPPPQVKDDYSDSDDDEVADVMTLRGQCRLLQPLPSVLRSEVIDEAVEKRRQASETKAAKTAARLASERQTAAPSETREEDFHAMWMRLMVDEFGEELDALRKVRERLLSSCLSCRG